MKSGMGLLPITFDCKSYPFTPGRTILTPDYREPGVLCRVPVAHSIVGHSQRFRVARVLDLDCCSCLLLH